MFILSKIIGTVGQPPALVLIVLILLLKSSSLRVRRLLRPFILLIYLMSISFGSRLLISPLESFAPPLESHFAELIVVPGGGSTAIRDGGELKSALSAESRSRILGAVNLHRTSGLPVLFCGGSSGEGRSSEADAAEELLLESGVPGHMIMLEGKSRSTRENARNAAEISDIRNIILITSAFHMKRAASSFRNEGFLLKACIKVAPRGNAGRLIFTDFLPSMEALSNSSLALHEYGGLIWYRLLNSVH